MTEKPFSPGPMSSWTVESSTYVLQDKWISVRADVCRTRDGVAIAPFYVLEFSDWVQVVALDDTDHIILVEQYRHGLGVSSLELPAGSVERQDADAVSAGRRELAEETGFQADNWQHIVSLAPNPANQSNRCHVVLAQQARLVGAAADDPTERTRVVRLPVAEVVRLARGGFMVQAMHVAALAVALTHIGRWGSLPPPS